MWTWRESDVPLIDAKFEVFRKMTEGKRRMVGCTSTTSARENRPQERP